MHIVGNVYSFTIILQMLGKTHKFYGTFFSFRIYIEKNYTPVRHILSSGQQAQRLVLQNYKLAIFFLVKFNSNIYILQFWLYVP